LADDPASPARVGIHRILNPWNFGISPGIDIPED
jgi:hypothetical protein